MKRRMSKGFTLIELMIVVAIIGILAAIAVPNFMKFQARARQSEAKVNLQAWGTATKSYYAEYNTYDCGACGWYPEKGNRYSYHVNGGGTYNTISATIPADTTTVGVNSAAASICTASGSTKGDATKTPTGEAWANIDTDNSCDKWKLDVATGVLSNYLNDVDA